MTADKFFPPRPAVNPGIYACENTTPNTGVCSRLKMRGNVAGRTSRDIEKRSGKAVVTSENYKELTGKGQKKLRK